MKRSPGNVITDLVRVLVAARQKRGVSQSDLGKKVGITQAQISRVERGLSDPQLTTLQNLAGALGLTVKLIPRTLSVVVDVLFADEAAALSGSPLGEDRPLYRLDDEDEDSSGASRTAEDVV